MFEKSYLILNVKSSLEIAYFIPIKHSNMVTMERKEKHHHSCVAKYFTFIYNSTTSHSCCSNFLRTRDSPPDCPMFHVTPYFSPINVPLLAKHMHGLTIQNAFTIFTCFVTQLEPALTLEWQI